MLYDDPPLSGEFDPKMEVFDGQMLPADEVHRLQSAVEPAPIGDVDECSLGF